MDIQKIINSETGKYIISIILGLGLATLFRRVCKDRKCLVFRAAPMNKIRDQIFAYAQNCYTFQEEAQPCTPGKTTVPFA